MGYILEASKLKKSFGETEILRGIDIKVEIGEFLAVMGQSGSGKSTLLYNISGMDRPSGGDVFFEGSDFSDFDEEELSRIRLEKMGFIFQKSYLLKTLSIRDNIIFPGFKARLFSRQEVNQYGEELMRRMGIDHVVSHDITKVSGGQLQRAAICRALINRPRIVFGDEPTGSLNSSSSKEVMDILNEINGEGTALMLVTHDPKVAARASRVIFLSDGNIVDEIELGKYEKKDSTQREAKMIQWLGKQNSW